MINNSASYIEKEFLSPGELISQTVKTKTLNLISEELKDLKSKTNDKSILGLIANLKYLVEDGYVISMYKFQFKIFTTALEEEIETIRQMIEHG